MESTIYVLWGLLIASIIFFVYHLIKWLIEDQVLQILGAKISGNIKEVAEIKRHALKKKIKAERQGVHNVKFSFGEKVFRFIAQTGIMEAFPGANEISILAWLGMILLIIGLIIGAITGSAIDGLIVVAVIFVIVLQTGRTLIGRRKMKIDTELLPFINSCMSSSAGQADIISIFQDIYPSMDEPLRSMLEACVTEANTTNDKRKAIAHLRDRSASDEFYSVVNNLYICSETSGEYEKTIKSLSKTLIIYNNNLEKKKAIIRNARANGILLGVLGVVALIACNGFYDGFLSVVISSPIGVMLIAGMVVLSVLVMTVSPD